MKMNSQQIASIPATLVNKEANATMNTVTRDVIVSRDFSRIPLDAVCQQTSVMFQVGFHNHLFYKKYQFLNKYLFFRTFAKKKKEFPI